MPISFSTSCVLASLRRRPILVLPAKVVSCRSSNRRFFSNKKRSSDSSPSKSKPQAKNAKPVLDIVYQAMGPFQMNQYGIACTRTGNAALIDCGATTQDELDMFMTWLQVKDYRLTAVWQTHAHLDHVAGLGMLLGTTILADSDTVENYGESIPIYLDEKDRDVYNNFERRCQDFGFYVEGGTHGHPSEDRLTFLTSKDDTTLSLGDLTFEIIPTPGHCPGHIGFFLQETNEFFGGDFIMKGSIGRTDFPESNHSDMQASLERFVKTMPDETIIYPGHGPVTTLKEEKQKNPFLRPFVR